MLWNVLVISQTEFLGTKTKFKVVASTFFATVSGYPALATSKRR